MTRFELLLAATIVAGRPVQALAEDFGERDAQVLGRTLAFVGEGITGPVVVGIAIVPGQAVSQQEAEIIHSVIGRGLQTGRVTLQVLLFPLANLGTVSGIDALYVTASLRGHMDALTAAATRLHIPTISADLACVKSDGCVVGFSSSQTVEIIIDRGAAERTGVQFLRAFRMLVKEK